MHYTTIFLLQRPIYRAPTQLTRTKLSQEEYTSLAARCLRITEGVVVVLIVGVLVLLLLLLAVVEGVTEAQVSDRLRAALRSPSSCHHVAVPEDADPQKGQRLC